MYPPGFDIQERARYFGPARNHEQARETLAERAHYTNDYDKHTDPEVMELRAKWAHDLRASRKAREVREILSTTLELIED